MIEWKCPYCYTTYDVEDKFTEVLKGKKNCKFCVHKSPNIPTTAEMNGLLTQKDMRQRNTVVFQCKDCKKWTVHENWVPEGNNRHKPCENCGEVSYDLSSIKSLRTYNPLIDNKRKLKVNKNKW